jgi:hypothetical protein
MPLAADLDAAQVAASPTAAISIGTAVSSHRGVRAVKGSGGTAIAVTEQDMCKRKEPWRDPASGRNYPVPPEFVQMLHNPIVLPAPGIMLVIAAQLLASGYHSPALRVGAEGWPHTVPAQRRQRIPGALVDAGGWGPGRVAACARRGGGAQ